MLLRSVFLVALVLPVACGPEAPPEVPFLVSCDLHGDGGGIVFRCTMHHYPPLTDGASASFAVHEDGRFCTWMNYPPYDLGHFWGKMMLRRGEEAAHFVRAFAESGILKYSFEDFEEACRVEYEQDPSRPQRWMHITGMTIEVVHEGRAHVVSYGGYQNLADDYESEAMVAISRSMDAFEDLLKRTSLKDASMYAFSPREPSR